MPSSSTLQLFENLVPKRKGQRKEKPETFPHGPVRIIYHRETPPRPKPKRRRRRRSRKGCKQDKKVRHLKAPAQIQPLRQTGVEYLIACLRKRHGMTRAQARKVLSAFFEAVKKGLAEGGKVDPGRLGTLEVKQAPPQRCYFAAGKRMVTRQQEGVRIVWRRNPKKWPARIWDLPRFQPARIGLMVARCFVQCRTEGMSVML